MPKVVGYLLMFGPVQEVHGVIWSMERSWCLVIFVLPVLSLRPLVHTKMSLIFCAWYLRQIQKRLSWTRHTIGCFARDQISKMFWPGPNRMDVLDMTKCLLTQIRFSCYTENKNFPRIAFVDSLGFKSFISFETHPVSVGTHAIFNASCKVFCWDADSSCGLQAQQLRCGGFITPWPEILLHPTRDWTSVPCTSQILSHWTTSVSQDSNLHCVISKPMLQFGLPGSPAGKESLFAMQEIPVRFPESGDPLEKLTGYPLQCSWPSPRWPRW